MILIQPRRRRAVLALDVDQQGWPQVGHRDPVIADAQAPLPGCGRAVSIPPQAAAWSMLAQRLRIVQAARLRAELIARHGQDGAFPPRAPWAGCDLDTLRAVK